MAYTVRLLPGGETFQVERRESVLDAAIRAGIPLDYGCSDGNCGRCKARLIEGEVQRIRRQDYVFPAEERAQGLVLLCTHTADSDLVLEASTAGQASEIPVQRFRAKVRRRELIDDEILILHLQTPRTQRLRFVAGQYATFVLPGLGEYSASIASCPCDHRHLEFHVRRLADDPYSGYLFTRLKPGDSLELRAPEGEFVIDDASRRPMILIAFDTGFAAIKSLLEHATAQERERRIHLYWIACGAGRQYLDNLCRSWQAALDEFDYTPLTIPDDFRELMDEPRRGAPWVGRALARVLADYPDLSGFDVYVSAPGLVLEGAHRLFPGHGLAAQHLRMESVPGNKDARCLVADTPSRRTSPDARRPSSQD
jgi:CDP-4-dehydro-6-deoxyglucose reductase